MKTLHKQLITFITIVIFGVSSFAVDVEALSNAEIEMQLTNITTLLTLGEEFPLLKNQIIATVQSALVVLLAEISNNNSKEDETSDSKTESIYPKSNSSNVEISTGTLSVDGDNNDYAQFSISFELNSIGRDSFLSEDPTESITYTIIESSGNALMYDSDGVIQNGSVIISLDSSADIDGGYFRINENKKETIEFNVHYLPYETGVAVGNGVYRLQLETVEYGFNPAPPTDSYRLSPSNKYKTGTAVVLN